MAESSSLFLCNYCGQSFSKRHNILIHINNVHVKESFICSICKKKFSNPIGLHRHWIKGHNSSQEGNPECDLCGKTFTRKENVVTHLRIIHGIGKKRVDKSCELCKKRFTNVKNLKSHIRKLHKPNKEPLSCDECNKAFRNKESLIAHIQAVHKLSAKDIHRCGKCEKVYCSKKNLKRHLAVSHGINDEYKCTVCSKTFGANEAMRRHMKSAHDIDLPREFACEHCSRVFSEQSFLRSHVSLHHKQDSQNPKKFSCECGKEFDSEPNLRQHIKSDHDFEVFYSYCKNSLLRTVPLGADKTENSTGFDCEVCQEHLESLYDLKNHMKANHEIQMSVETCNVCFVKFYSKQAMKQHQKVCQPPNNSMKCRHCDKLFTAKSSLNLHMKVFHREPIPSTPVSEDNSPVENLSSELKCKYCDKIFRTKFNVQQHVEYLHLGMQRFRCLECESHFKERRNLRKHIRLKHPKSTIFGRCDVCKSLFECAKSLKTHLKQDHAIDTDTIPCDICSSSFSTNDSLALHMKTKHKDEVDLFKCESCLILFKGYETFEKHSQTCQENTVSAPQLVPRCVICMKDFFTEKSLKRHIGIYHKVFDPNELAAIGFSKRSFVVDCKDCLEKFADKDLYKVYLDNKDIEDAIIFKCPTCADTYNAIEFAIQRYKKTKAPKRKASSSKDSNKPSRKGEAGSSSKKRRK